jgi:VWFA-related protein
MKGVIMKRIISLLLSVASILSPALAQSGIPQKPPTETPADDVLRITTELVQTDVVVMDKNDQVVPDLKLEDFELFESGKRQELQFAEFVNAGGSAPPVNLSGSAKLPPGVDTSVPRDLTAKDVRRVMAFVVDDVTIPSEDMARVRQMLMDFVDHKMQDGDLVAIVRTVGGKGLLEQFTTDRQILRRAITLLNVRTIPPYLATTGDDNDRVTPPSPAADKTSTQTLNSGMDFEGPNEGTNQVPRALLALSISNYIVGGLRQIPGRKSLVLLSGGLPLFDLSRGGSIVGDIGQLFRVLTDNATRSGVVINTMDVRGLKTSGAVATFSETPAKSALGGGTLAGSDENVSFGRSINTALLGDKSPTEQLTLRTLAGETGGVSIVNSNNFSAGLDKVLNRSRGYYRLAYRPSEKFDGKFHKLEVKVRRGDSRVYAAGGYYARSDNAGKTLTKEEQIIDAARSPFARRDLDVAAELQYKFAPDNQAQLDINTVIDANKLNFTRGPDGKYQASFEVVGFVFDQLGKSRGGISQVVKADLSEENYQRALTTGIGYTASTQVPAGYYQIRLVVREESTGRVGAVSRYFEVPELSNKQLTMSSLFLYGISPTGAKSDAQQLAATRVISRSQDLRYVAVVYNARSANNKSQVRSRLIISQAGKVLFEEPEQPLQTQGNSPAQLVKIGQLGLAKVSPGHYILTLVVTDPLADKKRQIISRSVDFSVVN